MCFIIAPNEIKAESVIMLCIYNVTIILGLILPTIKISKLSKHYEVVLE